MGWETKDIPTKASVLDEEAVGTVTSSLETWMQLWGAEEGSDEGLERGPPATRKGLEASAEGPLGLENVGQERL